MQKDKTNRLIYSASDLVNFTLCPCMISSTLRHRWKRQQRTPMHKYCRKKGSSTKPGTWTG